MKKSGLELLLWKSVVKNNENLVIPDIFDGIESYCEEHNATAKLVCAGAPWDSVWESMIKHLKPKVILEIGSYIGYSACKMAEYCKNLGYQDFSIVCIDPWLDCSGLGNFKERVHGYPIFYYKFLYNVKTQGHSDVIIPFPMPSQTAYKYIDKANVMADMIYVDGAHDYDDVYLDLTRYYQVLRPGGIICGDDWAWDSVRLAVNDACKELSINNKLQLAGGVWYIQK